MHAVEIDTRLEDVGVARQRERGEIAAIGTAPHPDSLRVDAMRVLQELRASEHVLILGCTGRPRAVRLMELSSITDAEPVVDRKHDETVSREILIHRIGIAVIVHVMPAEQHLTRWAAMHENDSGFGAAAI